MCPGTVTLRWPRVTSSPRIVYQLCARICTYTRMLVCNFVAFIFRRHRNVSWQLCYFALHPRWRDRRVSAHVQSCLISNLSTFSCTIPPYSLNSITWWFPRESKCNVAYFVVYYVIRIDTRTALFTSFYLYERSTCFFLNISQTIGVDSIHISILLLLLELENNCSTAIFDF